MKILKITEKNKEDYNKFVLENNGSFLQSYEWGEFQESVGQKVMRFFVSYGDDVILSATVLRYGLPAKKNYLYIPYGPVVKEGVHLDLLQEAFRGLIFKLRKESRKKGTIFLKVEQENSPVNLKNLKFKKSQKDVQARETLILKLEKTEEELLKDMKQKTRYNIRLASKKGVNFFELPEKDAAFSMFYSLLSKTSERNTFSLHPKRYYESMIDMFFNSEKGFKEKLYFAEYKGKILSCAMIGFYGNRATFLHGASSDENKNLMAPYLMHWEIIKKAKEAGMKEYDFWGIVTKRTDPKKRKAWQGFSRFKEGFGGEVVEYEGAYDISFSWFWYFLYKIVRKIKNV